MSLFESRMIDLARESSLDFKKCTEHHFQLKGIFLINIYPTKNKYYVQGSEKGIGYKNLKELIAICLGEQNTPKVMDRTERRHLTDKKPTLWKQSKFCFFCGEKINSMSEATIEHKIPLSRGGSNRIDNLALSHDKCNQNRRNDLSVEISIKEKKLIDEINELKQVIDYLTLNIKQAYEMSLPPHVNTYERSLSYRCEFDIETKTNLKG